MDGKAGEIRIGESGGLRHIFKAMAAHTNAVEVQDDALHAVFFLATSNEANMSRVITGGGLDKICAAMRAHPGRESLQQLACEIVSSVALLPTGRSAMRAGPAAQLVKAAVRAFPTNADIRACADDIKDV